MVRKFGADDPIMVISGNARANKGGARPNGAQTAAAASFGMGKRASWSLARPSVRPIDLERRARFARIETI
jgi:hypothetical protein